MTAIPLRSLLCLSLTLFCTPPLFAQSQESQTMDPTAIQSAIDQNSAAVSARDMEAILATYDPGATMVGQPGMAVTGTPAIRAAFEQFLAIDPKLTFTGQESYQAGDIALHLSRWTMTGKAPDGTPITQGGLSVVVLRQQADGHWLMLIDDPFGDQLLQQN